jgi:excisionase family DNA binding protein
MPAPSSRWAENLPLAVSPLQAARELSVCLTKIYALMRAGELDAFHSGRSRRITVDSVKRYMARQVADAGTWRPGKYPLRRNGRIKGRVAANA